MTTNLYNFNSGEFRDRYTRETGWVKLLFNHGKPLQTAELIEVQSILQDFLKQGLDTLFSNGTILSGLVFTIFSTTETDITLTMSSGKFYIDGLVIDISSTTITVSLEGEYTIGLVITPQIITEIEDPNLRDPIKGGATYGLPGAARLVWESNLDINNPSSFTLIKIVNGGIIQKQSNLYSKIDDSLADFTYLRNGNFCVKGLEPSVINCQPRAVDDLSKYNSLKASTDSSLDETQQAYTNLVAIKNNLDTIASQISQASNNYNNSPTNTNLVILQDLTQRQVDLQSSYDNASRLYASKKIISDKAESNLDSSKSLLVDKVYVSINPGVAYVEGYPIRINSPVVLEVPKSLEVSRVDSAVFTYSGTQATTQRSFSLATNVLWTDVVSQNTKLIIDFTKLLYQQQFVGVSISLDLRATSFNSLSTFLNFLVNELNKSVSSPLINLSISSTTLGLSAEDLRTILKNNLVIEKIGSSLKFSSTTINDVGNQLSVSISINRLDTSGIVIGASQVLIVDIGSANLAGAGSSTSFQLGFRPVADIISVVAELEENLKPLVRGPIVGTSDKLGDDSIFKITKVVQGDITYTEGKDYKLINQSEIDWSLSGNGSIEPSIGTTYYASFFYTQPLSKNTDYTLDLSSDSLKFLNTTPAPNQNFFVTYTYYLAKAGVVYLDKQGIFGYQLSESSINPTTPTIATNLLTVATFNLFANGVTLTPSDCSLVKLPQLNSLVDQVKRNTYNIETFLLDNKSRLIANNESVIPSGYYNSTIQDLSKLDFLHPLSNAGLSVGIQALTGGYIYKDVAIKYTSGGNIFKDELNKNLYVSLPYSNSIILSQERLTKTRVITQVSSTLKKRGKLLISPLLSFSNKGLSNFTACDTLSQQTTLLSRVSDNKSVILSRISTGVQNLFKSFGDNLYKSFIDGNPLGNYIQDLNSFLGYIGNIVKANSFTVSIKVENLPPSSEGYRVYLAGIEIKNYILKNSTPLSVIYPGTIKAKTDGSISLDFSLPNINFGVHTLEVISDGSSGYAKGQLGIYNNLYTQVITSALNNWDISFSNPIAKSMLLLSKTNTSDVPVFQADTSLVNPGSIPSVSLNSNTLDQQFPFVFDSVNQTFTVANYYYLTQVNIKLKTIDLNERLIINLGEATVNGPTRSLLGTAFASSYNSSLGGTAWTTFSFTHPIVLEPYKQYSLGLISKGTGYQVFTAEVGNPDLITNGLVGDQLYLQGDLFYSTDGKSLSKCDKEDLTYQLVGANFYTTDLIIDLGRYGNTDNLSGISSFALNTRDIEPDDSLIVYQYKPYNSSTWINFESNNLVCLSNTFSYIDLRATLSSSNTKVSPALLVQGSTVSLFLGLANSTIVSKQNIYDIAYKNAAVVLEYLQPAETTINVYYSPNDGGIIEGQEWFELTKDDSTTKFVDQGLQVQQTTWRYLNDTSYTFTGAERVKFRFRIDISTTNTAIQPTIIEVISYVY